MKTPEIHILNEHEIYDKNRYKAIFGDYDHDGIDNLDDPNPTKKGDKHTVEERKLTEGMSKLLNIKNNLDFTMHHAVKDLASVAPKDSVIYARTKTPYSIVQKLIEKRLIVPKDYKKGLTDLIGTTIAVDNYDDILKMRNLIENGKIYQVYEIEDFYKHPLDGYMAVHYILIYKDDKGTFPIELQLKTKRMKMINQLSHSAYAAHNLDKNRLLEATSLANRADKGDANAIKEFNQLMDNKEKLKESFYLDKIKKYRDGGDVENSIKEGQIYLNTTTDKRIIIDKVEDFNNDYPSVHYHIADEPKSYRNSNITRISLFENLVENGNFVLQNNTYKNGGDLESEWQEIPDNYYGKSAEKVWNLWTKEQKTHFLLDHFITNVNYKDDRLKYYEAEDLINNSKNLKYSELPHKVKNELQGHLNMGQYAEGGGLENFTTVEEYFKNLPFDKLPKEFSDYVKTEILTDSDLKHLSQNEPIFVKIKEKIDGYLKPEVNENNDSTKIIQSRLKLLNKKLQKEPNNSIVKTRIKLLSKKLSK